MPLGSGQPPLLKTPGIPRPMGNPLLKTQNVDMIREEQSSALSSRRSSVEGNRDFRIKSSMVPSK